MPLMIDLDMCSTNLIDASQRSQVDNLNELLKSENEEIQLDLPSQNNTTVRTRDLFLMEIDKE